MAKKNKEQTVEIKLDDIPTNELPPIEESNNQNEIPTINEENVDEKLEEIKESAIEEIKLDEVKEDELPPIEVIDTNNKPINNEAIDGNFVPNKFAPLKRDNKIGTIKNHNGRIYKIVRDNVGMWCDNGKLFYLSELK